jgi:integrase
MTSSTSRQRLSSSRARSDEFTICVTTAATLLLGANVHPKLVQDLLGHSSVAMTLDRYSHWIPSMGAQTCDAMQAALA